MIQGSKGGGTPVDANDTLYSVQRAEIVDLWGEGQIGGLVNGLKSVYLDNVPVENADGTRNFKDFAYQVSLGGPTKGGASQPHAFEDVATEVAVGVTVLAGVPVVRTIADPTVDAVRVTITVPALMESNDNGDRNGASFEWAIDVQSAGGGYVERHHDTVSGKASSAYSKAVKIDLKAVGPAPWDIRVRRITADSAVATLTNAFGWASYTALSGVRMLYPNSAGIGITFDARNFSAVPVRSYDLMGISDWDVPVNYNPLARTLAGNWNGLFKQAWTNNPAWVLYNLVQNKRYGLGEYITALPDKWTLYQLAQWCDGLVPDGRGGTEPRYTINACITQQSEALQLLQDICSVFRGALLYGGGTLGASWDAPGTPVASYVPANVVDGLFTYGDTSLNAMKSSCTCWYTDRSQFGKPMPATWDDPDLVERFGMRTMEIRPFGIASPGQALRMAKWALYTTAAEGATVAFRVGAQGQVGRIGEIFQVADPSEAGERLGGRVKVATTSQVTLDAPVTLLSGEAYTLWITMPDPASPAKLKLEHRAVSNGPGVTAVLNLATPLGAAPMPQTMWLLEGSSVAPTLWRYVGLKEVRNKDNGVEFEVTGLRYEPGKFALIEANQPLTVRPTRRLADGAPKPLALTIAETVYTDANVSRIRATVSWQAPAGGLMYQVSWRLSKGPWTTLNRTSSNTVDVDGLQVGLFEVQVRSVNVLGALSPAAEANHMLGGKNAPSDVTGLRFEIKPGQAVLLWDYCPDPVYEFTELRLDSWADGQVLAQLKASDYKHPRPDNGVYQVFACHFDGKLYSEHPVQLTVTIDDSIDAGSAGVVVQWSTDGSGVGAGAWHGIKTSADQWARWQDATGAWTIGFKVSGENGADGEYTDFRFMRSATQPPTPPDTDLEPAGWFDTVPAYDGTPAWALVGKKNGDGTLQGSWGVSRLEGQDGIGLEVEWSTDGTGTGAGIWHPVKTASDYYARWKDANGVWTEGWKATGEDGSAGPYTDFRFKRAATLPAMPSPLNDPNPVGWEDSLPAEDGNPAWAIYAKRNGDGTMADIWHGPTLLAGKNGQRSAKLEMFQWAVSAPTTFPAGTSTYTWATGAFTAPGTPNGWSTTPGAPVAGRTLWACAMLESNTGITPTTVVTWAATFAYALGAAGTNGSPGVGTPGPRGSLTGYSTSVSPAIYSTAPWNGATDDDLAAKVIWVMLGNSAATFVAGSRAHLMNGDQVSLKTAAGTATASRYWSGSAWVDVGAYIGTNLLVDGTITGTKNLAVTGYAKIDGYSSLTVPTFATGSALTRTVAISGNSSYSADIGVFGQTSQSSSANACGVFGYAAGSVSGFGVVGRGASAGVYGIASGSGGYGLYSEGNTYVNGRLDITGQMGINGKIFCNDIQMSGCTSKGFDTGGANLRLKSSNSSAGFGAFFRNDGSSLYLMLTASGDADGTWTSARPWRVDLATGRVFMDSIGLNVSPLGSGGGAGSFSGTLPPGYSATTNGYVEIMTNVGLVAIPVWRKI